MGYFEKSIRPHLKQSEDVLKMLNGDVVIDVFSNISKNDISKGSDIVEVKEKQLLNDLDKIFDIAADLSS